jgi:DNA-binding CsgD family transcriptional regulator
MGAVQHLKTLCCLGLSPEAAMVAVTPVLHEIIPHGWARMGILEPDATIGPDYPEHPEAAARFREHLWRFMDDPSALVSLWMPSFHAVGIGWSLHMQGRNYLDSAYYREVERPLDSCWVLDAMVGFEGRSVGFVHLTRPRSARPFTVVELQRLDQLRPWLAHMFRRRPLAPSCGDTGKEFSPAGAPVHSSQLVVTPEGKIVYQTPCAEFLLRILEGKPADYTRHTPNRDGLPAPVLALLRNITGAAHGGACAPPRMQLATPYGIVVLEAKWLVSNLPPEDVARDPTSCLIGVSMELREHAVAYVARVLRECGATPAQVQVGIEIAMGKTKPMIAQKLKIQASSVSDQTKKLYRRLDIHNAVELGLKIWLEVARQGLRSETESPKKQTDAGSSVSCHDHGRSSAMIESGLGSRH